MELKAGITIHGYTLVDFISSGATAEVWRVKDENGNDKALKIFSPVQKVDDATLDLLVDEFKLLYRLDHSHILKSEIMGAYQKIPYIIMPYYSGNLAAEMTRRSYQTQTSSQVFTPWFSEIECLTLMRQIGSGLAYLHEQGIIHQDVKPENILFNTFSDQVQYVLTDFGISTKIKENIARMTMPRDQPYALTPAYASPEQFSGRQDFKSDVFSLGVLLFEMCEGRLPFTKQGYTPDVYGKLISPYFRNPHLSIPFKNIILAALSENPGLRPTAKDFEDFASQSKDKNKLVSEESPIRTEKVTILQPRRDFGQNEGDNITGAKTPQDAEPPSPPTIMGSNKTIRYNPREINIPGTIRSPLTKGSRKGKLLTLLITLGLLAGVVLIFFKSNLFLSSRQNLISKVLIMKDSYSEIRPFHSDRAMVKRDGKWGYINSNGKLVIPCSYMHAGDFNGNYAFVCKSEIECGIIGKDGDGLTPFIYDGVWSGAEGSWILTMVENGKKITKEIKF